jgi:acetyl/propionyl-CoA carboxylase alpha subunit
VDDKIRKKIGKAARKAARAVRYCTVGTVEFLLDERGDFYFIEMNTRIQVEHPVTELVTGIDLVKEQIRLAAGEELGYDKNDVHILAHAIECRVNAEDSTKGFTPSPGKIDVLMLPGGPGVRVDTHVYAGYTVPSFYDSLIAKVIVSSPHGRHDAINKMERALSEFVVEGIKTTIPFHKKVLASEAFKKGDVCTNFIEKVITNGSGPKN